MTKQLAPSIFAADFADMASVLKSYEETGVDLIHFDVMDNHFVPNISFGPKFIQDICNKTSLASDAHLMIDLENGLDDYLELPVDYITIHLEATRNYIHPFLKQIRQAGKKAGVSLKPQTPVTAVAPYLDELDLILVMSVEPGFSGQKFMPESKLRLKELSELRGDRDIVLQIDGGIGRSNYREVLDAGADCLVMGSAYFKDEDIKGLCQAIHEYS